MKTKLPLIQRSLWLLALPCLLLACGPTEEEKKQYQMIADAQAYNTTFDSLTTAQEEAMDALTTLQVSSDEKSQLYSTFAAHNQPCYPPDTNIIISQAEFRIAMQQFVNKHCKKMPAEQRDYLANTAALSQADYAVLHCRGNSVKSDYENGIPLTGYWVIPCVLGRRDLIIVW